MSHPISDERLDREIRAFLAWDAETTTDGPSALEMSARVSSRMGMSLARLTAPRLVWVMLAGLLALALATAALGGVALLRDDAPSYEAVFLRFDEGSSDVSVIGVDADGRERDVAKVRDARLSEGPPVGVVSSSGLLAIPRPVDGWLVHWEMADLRHPDAEPIVIDEITQDVEQLNRTPFYRADERPSPFWGPGERLALTWYERIGQQQWYWSFVDGRTGALVTVEAPGEDLEVLPQWAADGSGLIVGRWGDRTWSVDPPVVHAVLRPDGTISEGVAPLARGASSRRYRGDGTRVAAPGGRVIQDGSSELLSLDDVEITDVAWTAEGDGPRLAVRSSTDDPELSIERVVPPAVPTNVATLRDATPDPAGSRVQGHLIGLAPDDSMIVVSLDRVTGTESDGGLHPVAAAGLVSTESGELFEIEGSFAGWIEVD